MANKHKFLSGNAIDPKPVTGDMTVADWSSRLFSLTTPRGCAKAASFSSNECSTKT